MEGLNTLEINPWNLAIEALLHMQQVDLSIISELIRSVPGLSNDLGRNAREMLELRVMEKLYASKIRNKNTSVQPPTPQTKRDVSHFCQEAVDLILHGASPSNLRFDEAHILELDITSFISEKRSRIQNCYLHQLKNAILEGSNPVLEPLKDGSGLEFPDENSRRHFDGDVSNGKADKHGVSRNTEATRKLASLTAEDDEILEDNLPVKKLSPAKRVRIISVARNCEVASAESCGRFEESPKKLNRVLSCFPKKTREFSAWACQHEQLGESSSRTAEHIEEPADCKTQPEVQSMEESKGNEDHCAHKSARLKENNDIDPGVVCRVNDSGLGSQYQKLVPYADSTSEDMSGEDDAQVNFSDKANGSNQCALEPPAITVNVGWDGSSEANDFIIHSCQNNVDHAMSKDNDVHGDILEISSDSDEYDDVMADIAMRKNSFLSSQGIDTQDSLGTQLNSCVKCKKGGNVLSCSSSSCPLVVHKECLGSAIGFDKMGNFYCPFCAYSQSISRHQEAKKKFSLSRTDLMSFHVFRADLTEKSSSKRSHVSNGN